MYLLYRWGVGFFMFATTHVKYVKTFKFNVIRQFPKAFFTMEYKLPFTFGNLKPPQWSYVNSTQVLIVIFC